MPQPIARSHVPTRNSTVLPIAALVAAAACWGFGTVVTKQVLNDVEPLTLLPLQLAASCIFLTVASLARRDLPTWNRQTRRLAALGILNPGAAYALGLLGLASITASLSVLLWAVEPVLITLLAILVLREHVPATRAAALGVAVAGALLIVYQPGATGDARGVALTLAGVAACALYTVLTRALLLDDGSLPVVLSQQVPAFGFAIVVATAAEVTVGSGWSLSALNTDALLGAATSGVLYYGLAFWFYVVGLRRLNASAAGAFLPLIPVFGVLGGYLIGERLEGQQWVGAAIVVAATVVLAFPEMPGQREEEVRLRGAS